VFAGHCRLVRLGYRQGGAPGYGLWRELVDENRCSKGFLLPGQRKYLQTDRVLLRPGPVSELDVVRRIFKDFVVKRKSQSMIARGLNAAGATLPAG
jgi:hypothetical protein